jgi:hypothetical protein
MSPEDPERQPEEAKRKRGFDWKRFLKDLGWVGDLVISLLALLAFWA